MGPPNPPNSPHPHQTQHSAASVSFPRLLLASAGALVLSFKGCTVFRPIEAIAGGAKQDKQAKQAKQASARPKTVRKFGTNQIRKS